MDLSRAVFATLLLTVAALAGQAAGQASLEIIPLRHRTADQVLPALRPLLEPGATLTGQGTQLIVRTSPGNLDELRRALDEIDRPLRRLQVSQFASMAQGTAHREAWRRAGGSATAARASKCRRRTVEARAAGGLTSASRSSKAGAPSSPPAAARRFTTARSRAKPPAASKRYRDSRETRCS